MKTLVTLTQRELLSLSPEVQLQVHEAMLAKQTQLKEGNVKEIHTYVEDDSLATFNWKRNMLWLMVNNMLTNILTVLMGLSTDGFAPFGCHKHTCWPLIICNYNLPLEICMHLKCALPLGAILGPNKPKDFNSYMWLVVKELMKLELGSMWWGWRHSHFKHI